MRVLFQGAGAIGIAGAALFADRHEVAVVSREPVRKAAFPASLSTVSRRTSGIRRVPVTDWATVLDLASQTYGWELLVLTTRPGDLDVEVVESVRRLSPPMIASTSQVEGDLDLTREMFPDSEVIVFSPAFLSERTDDEKAGRAGADVRYWSPPGAPAFMMTGGSDSENLLRRALGSLVLSVPAAMVFQLPAVFIPYVAELSVRGGDWAELKAHLDRPSRASAEAVRAVTGHRIPIYALAARAVLEVMERATPIDFGEYAGRHFGRHIGQTIDMLEGWAARAGAGEGVVESAPALRDLALALRAAGRELRPVVSAFG